jgi:hypothetical protein
MVLGQGARRAGIGIVLGIVAAIGIMARTPRSPGIAASPAAWFSRTRASLKRFSCSAKYVWSSSPVRRNYAASRGRGHLSVAELHVRKGSAPVESVYLR